MTVKASADHFSQRVPSFIERQMRASQSTPELHQLERFARVRFSSRSCHFVPRRAPSGGLAFRASQRSPAGCIGA